MSKQLRKKVTFIILLILICIVWFFIFLNIKENMAYNNLAKSDMKITKRSDGCYDVHMKKLDFKICDDGIYKIEKSNCTIIKPKNKEPIIFCN